MLVAYGSPARICKTVVDLAREEGMKVGLSGRSRFPHSPRPANRGDWPSGKRFLVVEMSRGQMVEDVRLAVNGMADVAFYGRTGGAVPTPTEILNTRAGELRQAAVSSSR